MASKSSKTQSNEGGQGLFVEPGMLARMIETCVREVLEAEVTRHLGAEPYQRGPGRRGHRNGSKPRTMKTAVGTLSLDVPQVRAGDFRPSVFERYQRSDKALVAALQEMVVQGVSTRRVGTVLEQMAGFEVSAMTVSRAMAELDEQIAAWRNRPLEAAAYPYLIIDARYEKVRVKGRVVSQAVLVAAGIDDAGRRELLGLWIGDSESETTWGQVLSELKRRGLKGVELVVSDAHSGIRAALGRQLQGVAWQRCRVHLMRELLKRVGWKDYRELAADLRAIFVNQDAARCREVAQQVAAKWMPRAAAMARTLEAAIEDCLTAKSVAPAHWRRLNSTNMLERLMKEFKQRTRSVGAFPNQASLLRLIGAIALEIDQTWECEPIRYLTLN